MDNREYIIKHRHEDVRRLALGRAEQGVDMPFCLRQIEAWQKACTKLPRWAETDDILFPPRINMDAAVRPRLNIKEILSCVCCLSIVRRWQT